MTYSNRPSLTLWSELANDNGRDYVVVSIGPRRGISAVSCRRQLPNLRKATIRAETLLAKQALADVLRNVADHIEADTVSA